MLLTRAETKLRTYKSTSNTYNGNKSIHGVSRKHISNIVFLHKCKALFIHVYNHYRCFIYFVLLSNDFLPEQFRIKFCPDFSVDINECEQILFIHELLN